jgi:hypothetical protein
MPLHKAQKLPTSGPQLEQKEHHPINYLVQFVMILHLDHSIRTQTLSDSKLLQREIAKLSCAHLNRKKIN